MTLLPKKLLLASLPLLAAVMPVYATGNGDNNNEVIRSVVYEPGDYGSRFYRIPAIVTLDDGSLVSVADKRINNIADLPNDIDVVCRRSTDGGRSWSEYITVARHDSIGGYGDPALVCDRNSGDLIVISTHGQGLWLPTPGEICVSRSSDGGLTWMPPVSINDQILTCDPDGSQPIKCNSAFASSGRAVQLSDGRIMFVLVTRREGVEQFTCYAVYSDDGGHTWHVSATPTTTDGDESKIAQTADGTLITSIRDRRRMCRLFSRSTDNGVTWSPPRQIVTLPDPACNGDFIRYTHDGHDLLLHSLPTGGSRHNVTIFVSRDNGATWTPTRRVARGASAYSSMTVLPDGSVGILTEEAANPDDPAVNDGYRICYTRIPASEIVGHRKAAH